MTGGLQTFEVATADLHRTRVLDEPVPEPGPGQVVARIDGFGFTANNISYAAFADLLGYWQHFPAADGWGRVPVWGFAEVVAGDAVPAGTRIYGYLPMATHVVLQPERVTDRSFHDGAEHRRPLAAAYSTYQRTAADPVYRADRESQRMLLWPLFVTAFLVDDALDADGLTGGPVVLSSASSRTAIGTARLLAERGDGSVVGLTSERNRAFVEGLGVYDHVLTYGHERELPGGPAVYLDFSGDAGTRRAVHERYGPSLARSVVIGGTHWDAAAGGGDLPGPAPAFFFAPDRVKVRTDEWGQEELDRRIGSSYAAFVDWTDRWFRVEEHRGPDEVARVYADVLDGRLDPAVGLVLSMEGGTR